MTITITERARAIVALDDELQKILREITLENLKHARETAQHQANLERLHQRGRLIERAIRKFF